MLKTHNGTDVMPLFGAGWLTYMHCTTNSSLWAPTRSEN